MTPFEENERQYRVIDQMITMHAALRDRYHRLGTGVNLVLLSGSIVLNGLVFADDGFFQALGLNTGRAKCCLGFVSILLLVASLVEYRVDWCSRSRLHDEAVRRLSLLKAMFRENHAKQEHDANVLQGLTREYALTMQQLPPIPEKHHSRLKALHRFKRNESEMIDRHPSAPLFFIRIKLRMRGVWDLFRDSSDKEA